ncbi:MAG: hypothetical protein IT350_19860 [Deltaproteobacteria bacterium]|nr:hypothetical protein [Deltaproteobacteria bacterium]
MRLARLPIVLVVFACLAAVGCPDEWGNELSGFDTDGIANDSADILTGRATLEGQGDNASIQILLGQLDLSMLTADGGLYRLPRDLPEGEWELEARYPYHHSAKLSFQIENGVPTDPLPDITLERALDFTVTTNGYFFTFGDSVIVTLAVENISTEPHEIRSSKKPIEAMAVVRNGEIVFGGLVPGLVDDETVLTFEPGDTLFYEFLWKIGGINISPGEYEIYAVLTSDLTHPEYFSKPVDGQADLNAGLFERLRPAVIRVD